MFGTMDDFESLMATAKDNGIEIMLDMVCITKGRPSISAEFRNPISWFVS
jgi:glycosidase